MSHCLTGRVCYKNDNWGFIYNKYIYLKKFTTYVYNLCVPSLNLIRNSNARGNSTTPKLVFFYDEDEDILPSTPLDSVTDCLHTILFTNIGILEWTSIFWDVPPGPTCEFRFLTINRSHHRPVWTQRKVPVHLYLRAYRRVY